tara:strand:+ start:474 stop:1652 length:1179 start_codon:yes stop_codon:yes gene_type:complete
MRLKICIFSGSRSEYSLLKSVISNFKKKKSVTVFTIFANSHFQQEYGYTINQTIKDKIKINKKIIPYQRKNDFILYNNLNIIKSLYLYLKKINPHYLIIYGDRYETFTAAYTASFLRIPIIHIEGGDITEGGALDDLFRHSITRLSHLHFVTNKKANSNLLKSGEEKWRIKRVGLPSLNDIKKIKIINYKNLMKKYKIINHKKFIIFTLHPLSNNLDQTKIEIDNSLKSLIHLSKFYFIIITYPNNDYGSDLIIKKINQLKKMNLRNLITVKSLGGEDYFSFLSLSKLKNIRSVCLGNSSSGIKEAVSFKCPSINIGDRQKGREKPKSVINVNSNYKEIIKKTKYALENNEFRKKIKHLTNPYYMSNSSLKIINIILNNEYNKKKLLLKKYK